MLITTSPPSQSSYENEDSITSKHALKEKTLVTVIILGKQICVTTRWGNLLLMTRHSVAIIIESSMWQSK